MRLRTRSFALDPLAYSIDEAAQVAGLGRTMIKAALAAGELPFVKIGTRTLILDADLRAYLSRYRVTRGDEAAFGPSPEAPALPAAERPGNSVAPARRRPARRPPRGEV